MKIRELAIRRYGPLPEFPRTRLSSFTLLFGNNEHGKTLIIDAIIKLLFKKNLGRGKKGFDNLQRVPELPEGDIVLEGRGREIRLGREESIGDRFDPPVTVTDFRNIFVTRDSDLSIETEKEYYAGISEKLTGLMTSEIRSVLQELRKRGRLTSPKPDGDLSDSKDAGYAASKVQRAGELTAEADALLARLKAEKFDLLERDLAQHQGSLASMREERELLQSAAVRTALEDAGRNARELGEIEAALEALDAVSDERHGEWQALERRKQRSTEERESVAVSIETATERERGAAGEVERALNAHAVQEDAKRYIDDRIRPRIEGVRRARDEFIRGSALRGLWRNGTGLSLLFVALGITGMIVSPSPVFTGIVCLAAVCAAFFASRLLLLGRARGSLDRDLDAVFIEAARIHDGEHSLEALERSIAEAENERARLQSELDQREKEAGKVRLEIEHLRERERSLAGDLARIDDAIDVMRADTGMGSSTEYRARLESKRTLLLRREKLVGALENAIGREDGTEAVSRYYEREIEARLRRFPPGIQPDPVRLAELEGKIADGEDACARARETLGRCQGELDEVAFKIRSADILESESVVCRTTADLAALSDRLNAYRQVVLEEKTTAQEAIRLFQEIEAEEKSRVSDLFGAGRPVSDYFREITGGFYEEVRFDPETERISVVARDGGEQAVELLSGGTFDQLYFSIRLSLGERFLGSEGGFFILDDPFVKADHERLSRQIALLRHLAAKGWQVLYFSAKRETLDMLRGDIDAGAVHLIRLDEHV